MVNPVRVTHTFFVRLSGILITIVVHSKKNKKVYIFAALWLSVRVKKCEKAYYN